jgi:hypothetical protein
MTLVEIKKKIDSVLDKNLQMKYRRLQQDYLWILVNEEKLRKGYPNKYIAVQNQTVGFVDDSIEGIVLKITQSGRQVEDYAIEYIGQHPVNFLF